MHNCKLEPIKSYLLQLFLLLFPSSYGLLLSVNLFEPVNSITSLIY